MKPVYIANSLFEKHGLNFDAVLSDHLKNPLGYVYSGEECFVMATLENSEHLMRHNLNKPLTHDTWFVYVYAGDLKRVLTLVPFRMKYVGFRRNYGAVKLYDMEKLFKKIGR